MRDIEAKLRDTVGLDVAALGHPSLARIVLRQMQSAGVAEVKDFSQLLATSPAHWQELIESVVVAETWFFREPEVFSGLIRFIRDRWLPLAPAEPLRLLSLPCASGEEPYSVVMTLLDAGLSPERFLVVGSDISARALARAQHGVYGKNAFRNKDLGFRERYFRPSAEGFVLHPSVRDRVAFQRGNLISNDIIKTTKPYDCIFCRNLLIYFDEENQRKALNHIRRLLRPGGILFVGPAEQGVALNHGFVSAGLAMGFFCPATKPHEPAFRNSGGAPIPGAWSTVAPEIVFNQHQGRGAAASLAPPQPARKGPDDLELILGIADAGHLEEAMSRCTAYLDLNRDSAQAYYLLGLLHDAAGLPASQDCYRKALYLQPDHQEALLQMALLAERRGDNTGAANLRRRAGRAQPTASEL